MPIKASRSKFRISRKVATPRPRIMGIIILRNLKYDNTLWCCLSIKNNNQLFTGISLKQNRSKTIFKNAHRACDLNLQRYILKPSENWKIIITKLQLNKIVDWPLKVNNNSFLCHFGAYILGLQHKNAILACLSWKHPFFRFGITFDLLPIKTFWIQ